MVVTRLPGLISVDLAKVMKNLLSEIRSAWQNKNKQAYKNKVVNTGHLRLLGITNLRTAIMDLDLPNKKAKFKSSVDFFKALLSHQGDSLLLLFPANYDKASLALPLEQRGLTVEAFRQVMWWLMNFSDKKYTGNCKRRGSTTRINKQPEGRKLPPRTHPLSCNTTKHN